jgi:regulatory protein YycI of two-component signal transduction system YycFG
MIEVFVLIFVAGNFFLQFGWFLWSRKVEERKHFTDSESINSEIDIIHSIQAYVDAKVENELAIRARDKEWEEFMKPQPQTQKNSFDTFDPSIFTQLEDPIENPNKDLERGPDGKFNPDHIEGKFDGIFK